jgi:NADH-quinone oxidoreductase subunit L
MWHFLGMDLNALTTICILLFIGAMGKSAQIGLHTWLPDAMEGPTPVSALIHAATMVTAGVFMVVRCSPLFELSPTALAVVTVIGASTCFFAASVGLVQNDIKRVIAYSTCSQLGYMFFAAGVGAYSAAIFHLFTHAFFKALLFLGSGAVIHGMHDEQDMRKMGGIWKKMPITYAYMWIGSLALMGIPFFAGFYSKDMVLEVAWAAHTGVGTYAYVLGLVAAFMTAFYSGRLIFMTFHGETRADHDVYHHAHDAPPIMWVPLLLLAAGAIFSGFLFHDYFVGEGFESFWRSSIFLSEGNEVVEQAHHITGIVKQLPLVAGGLGLLLSWLIYIRRPAMAGELARTFHFLYQFLLNKWYFDELYDVAIVRPAKAIGRFLWKEGDGRVIDGFGPNRAASFVIAVSRRARAIQTGYVYHYAFAIVVGVALIVTWYMIYGGNR